MNMYEVLKECWIKTTRYLPTQLVKLTSIEAKEWLDRKCIKLANSKKSKKDNSIAKNTTK